MRHQEVAQTFIRYYLPTELSEQFDLSTLKIHKDTFIDQTEKVTQQETAT